MFANDRGGIVNLLPKQPKYYRKNRCHSQKHLKSTSSLFSGSRHLSLPPLGGRLQLPTRWSPSSISWCSYNNGVNHSLFACQNIFGMTLLKLTKRRLSIMSSTAHQPQLQKMMSSSLPKCKSLFLKPNFCFNLNTIPYVGL